jgi:hypothetical protein
MSGPDSVSGCVGGPNHVQCAAFWLQSLREKKLFNYAKEGASMSAKR